jgi:hypothetical protein
VGRGVILVLVKELGFLNVRSVEAEVFFYYMVRNFFLRIYTFHFSSRVFSSINSFQQFSKYYLISTFLSLFNFSTKNFLTIVEIFLWPHGTYSTISRRSAHAALVWPVISDVTWDEKTKRLRINGLKQWRVHNIPTKLRLQIQFAKFRGIKLENLETVSLFYCKMSNVKCQINIQRELTLHLTSVTTYRFLSLWKTRETSEVQQEREGKNSSSAPNSQESASDEAGFKIHKVIAESDSPPLTTSHSRKVGKGYLDADALPEPASQGTSHISY